MPSNIEIKARASNLEQMRRLVEQLADGPPQTVFQHDVFFNVSYGRLKLRTFSEHCGELIFYERPDCTEPKQCDYQICGTSDPRRLREVLSAALSESVVVRKKRTVFLVGQTRVHLDEVEDLGAFVELEVVLQPGQSPAEGHEIANDLMAKLRIDEADLVPFAYADLLQRTRNEQDAGPSRPKAESAHSDEPSKGEQ